MKIQLTGVELEGIADRLAQRLESALKRTARRSAPTPRRAEAQTVDGTVVERIRRELAWDLAPLVCPEDSLLSARQAQSLMGIRKSKWHELRRDGLIPDPIETICGNRWYRSTILRAMHDADGQDESVTRPQR